MSNQILVPSLGESITEATVSKWLKRVGETVDTEQVPKKAKSSMFDKIKKAKEVKQQ